VGCEVALGPYGCAIALGAGWIITIAVGRAVALDVGGLGIGCALVGIGFTFGLGIGCTIALALGWAISTSLCAMALGSCAVTLSS
jgi:hypothetical protein